MDKLIIADRQTGKTRKLIEQCHKDRYSIIVCPTMAMCSSVFKEAQDLGMLIPYPITFYDFVKGNWRGRFIDKFYFDELQMSLEKVAKGNCIGTVVIGAENFREIEINRKQVEQDEIIGNNPDA